MKKILISVFCIIVINVASFSQCTLAPIALVDSLIDCGDSAEVFLSGFTPAISEEFSATGPTDPGWQTTAGAVYNNPFIPSLPFPGSGNPDGGTYFWMGATNVLPAALVTTSFAVNFGGQICFDFVYAIQGGPSGIAEGPDLSEEGITLQYSPDGGTTWIDITYFMPNGEQLPSNPGPNFPMTNPPFSASGTPYTVWNSVCIPIPAGANGPNTSFQWIQEYNSGSCCDHWGLDNIQINLANPGYSFYQNGVLIDTSLLYVSPTDTTTYEIIFTNGIDDTCIGSYTVNVNPTVAMDDIFTCEGTAVGDTLSLTGVAPWASVTWSPAIGLDDPNSQTPFANPPSPGPDITYTVTSACGSDSVVLSFYLVDAVAEKDTVCPGEVNQLFGNVTGISQDCLENYTSFPIPFYKEFSTSTTPASFSNANNGTSAVIPLPFPFEYYCQTVTDVRMAADGYLVMSSAAFPSFANNITMPANLLPNNIVALMWDDLVDSTGLSNYFVTGTAPNRKMVFEYDLVHNGGTPSTEPVQGQIILHESTNFIDLICENCTSDASDPSATQGIENSTGFVGQATPGRNNSNWQEINGGYRYIPNTNSATAQTVSWSPTTNLFGSNTLSPLVTPDTTTQYTVTVINNEDSCTYFDTVTVYVDQLLQVDAGADTSICLGESLVLQASSTVTNNIVYTWTPNNGSIDDNTLLNPTVTPDTATQYFLEANANGCFANDSVIVGISSFTVDSTVLVDEICIANSGAISIFTTGQTAGLQYSIDDGVTYQASNVFTGLAGGNYDIRIGSTNCDTSYTVNIVGGAALISIDSILVENANCGNLGSIDLYASGGTPPLQYSIDNGTNLSGNTFYPNLSGAIYPVRIVDNFGCILDTNITVIETPLLGVFVDNLNTPSCFGAADGSVDLGVTGGQAAYQYSLDSINFQSSLTFAGLDTGSYIAYVIDTNGCEAYVNFVMTQPDALDVQITVPGNVLCAGGTIDSLVANVVGGTPAYSYLWNTTEVSPSIENIVVGTYWVEVSDINGCADTDSVIINQPVPLFLNIASDSVQCGGQNSGLAYIDSLSGGTPTYTYSWTGPAGAVSGIDTALNLVVGQYILTVSDFNGCAVSDTSEIFEPTAVTIDLVSTPLACNGDTSACIDATINGGTPPYTIAWSNGDNVEDICGLSAGWYNITVTDARSCVYLDSIEVIEPSAISLSTTQVDVSCYGLNNGSATVNVTGGTPTYTFDWTSTGQITATASNLLAGAYTVIVTDNNLCVDSISVTITEPTDSISLSVDSVIEVLCNGASTGQIQVSTSGGTAPYSYSWTNGGGTNEDLLNAGAGTYTLTVTDANGCPISSSAMITEPTALGISLNGTNTTCFGASTGSIDASVTGGTGPYTYNWTGPNGFSSLAEDLANIAAGTYSLTVTDANNCLLSQNIIITEPAVVVIAFSEDPVNCFGGNDGSLTASISAGGTAPFTFQWDAAANNQIGATATGLSAGNYLVTVTDANGCIYTSNANITEPTTPLSINLDSTNITCGGYNDGTASVSVSGGTPGYSYLWSDPLAQTTATSSALPPGNFQVTVTDANGCTISGSINIVEPPVINISAIADSTNCFGDASGAISVTANGGTTLGFAYSIDGGETFQSSPDFFNLPAGVYDEIIAQDLGSPIECLSPLTTATIYEQPFFSFEVVPGDTTLQLEESIELSLNITSPNYSNNDIAQVNWFPTTGLNCSDCIDPTVLTYDSYTEYTVTVYYNGDDNELCNATASTIIIVENNLALFIPNAFTPGNFDQINNQFEVYGEGIEYVTMQIFNRIGEKIFESSNQEVGWDGTFKGKLQNPGVYTYFVSVEYLDGKVVDRKGSVSLIR